MTRAAGWSPATSTEGPRPNAGCVFVPVGRPVVAEPAVVVPAPAGHPWSVFITSVLPRSSAGRPLKMISPRSMA